MKNTIIIIIAITLSSLFFLDCFMFPESEIAGNFKTKNVKLETVNSNGFAVVELFTSEGCSSCPPADELVAQLQNVGTDKNIYLLAYHVDYWDRLGWKDQFSSNDFTKRQEKYQDWLNLHVMYTPQFIINGTTEFAGYNETALFEKVSDALKTKQTGSLEVTANAVGTSLIVNFKTDQIQENSNLLVAVVQKQAISKVERGENKGNTLHHVQIVRQLKSFPLHKTEGSTTLKKPANFNSTDWELIGFTQNNVTGRIIQTTKTDL
jgi:hypothetical protein